MDQHPQQSQRNHHDSYSSSPMPYGAHPQIMDHNSDAFEFNGSSSSAPVSIGSTGVMSSSMQQPILVSSPEVLGLLNTPMPIDNHHHHQNQHASTLHAPPPPVSIPGNPAAEQMAAQAQAQAEAAVAAAVAAAAHQPMGMSLDSTSLDHLLQLIHG
ncbi:hypothetical protein BCR43DRAFT_503716 [Syncephalastrum racemosum]|uniref:Uncharacterized protein n=1 Tax=Syncephalastrum racemosum TaxID=13706 RepID=A0A1X2HIR5_SYNRA|nr:hypothetical protein BCR43DRAFT_503716 [Syncephalastrum racemosum]